MWPNARIRSESPSPTPTRASSSAPLISPARGGLIAARWGIRATFLLAFVCYSLSTLLVYRTEPERAGARRVLPRLKARRGCELGGLWGLLLNPRLASGVA